MVLYICKKCNKVFNKKSNFDYHCYNRKRPCNENTQIIAQKDNMETNKTKKIIKNKNNFSGNFKCPTCGNNYSTKGNLTRHLQKKCTKIELKKFIHFDENIGEKVASRAGNNGQNPKESKMDFSADFKPKKNPKKSSSTTFKRCDVNNVNRDCSNDQESIKKIDFLGEKSNGIDLKCNFCNRVYSTNSNLNKHLRKCKVKQAMNNEREIIFQQLLKENEEKDKKITSLEKEVNTTNKEINLLKSHLLPSVNNSHNTVTHTISNMINSGNTLTDNSKTINALTNIDNSINNNNNIKLVAFGNEDLSYINDNTCKKILGNGFTSIPVLVKYVHFNKNNPKFHNVYISNMRDNFVITFDGEKWKLKDRNETIEKLVDDKRAFLEEKYYTLEKQLPKNTQLKFTRYMREADTENVTKDIFNSIKRTLYNGKEMPLKVRKLLGS